MSREEALDTALGQIERQFGKGAVMRMNDRAHVSVGSISSRGSPPIPSARSSASDPVEMEQTET